MDPLQDEAAAEGEAGDKAEHGPPAGADIKPRDVRVQVGLEKSFRMHREELAEAMLLRRLLSLFFGKLGGRRVTGPKPDLPSRA
jgi:hypothetical protein